MTHTNNVNGHYTPHKHYTAYITNHKPGNRIENNETEKNRVNLNIKNHLYYEPICGPKLV